MERLKTVGLYFVAGLACLGIIIMYGVAKAHTENFNYVFFGIGSSLVVPGLIALYLEFNKAKRTETSGRANLAHFKTNSIRIPVDLSQCTVTANTWTQVREEKTNKEILFNELIGDSFENRETDNIAVSLVKYTTTVQGQRRTFTSAPVAKDKTTLLMLLEMQKETNIYIDRDGKYYYFDLEFLEK
ncbi:hypothetical protein [Chryseolinea soli]|nr:hypothetical protein [Chryseolinea soli]